MSIKKKPKKRTGFFVNRCLPFFLNMRMPGYFGDKLTLQPFAIRLFFTVCMFLVVFTSSEFKLFSFKAQAQFGMKMQKVGVSRLFEASRQGDWQSVDYLLKSGSDPNVSFSEDGSTPLILATIGRHFDIVETLIEFDARLDTTDVFGRTALSWAAEQGEYEIASLLLNKRANPNHQNKEGSTPLMLAIKSSHLQLVRLLLEKNADVSIRDYTGRSAFDWAQAQRNQDIVGILSQAGGSR